MAGNIPPGRNCVDGTSAQVPDNALDTLFDNAPDEAITRMLKEANRFLTRGVLTMNISNMTRDEAAAFVSEGKGGGFVLSTKVPGVYPHLPVSFVDREDAITAVFLATQAYCAGQWRKQEDFSAAFGIRT